MRRSRKALVGVALATLASCGGEHAYEARDVGTPSPHDSWLRRPEFGVLDHRTDALPDGCFAFVPEAARPAALARLEDATHVVLDTEEAARFGGDALTAPEEGAVPVLLRGLVVAGEDPHVDRFPPEDGLQILWADGSASVEFFASRLRHEPDVRRPVVALLPRAPAAVYTVSFNVIVGGVRPPE